MTYKAGASVESGSVDAPASGHRGIRTPGTSRYACFQDKCVKPLRHVSKISSCRGGPSHDIVPPMGLEPTTHTLRGCCSTDRAKGGRRGYDRIRTYGTSRFTRFPSVRHRPLGHVSIMRPDHPMSIVFSKSSAKNNRVSSGGGGNRTHSAETSDLQSDAPLQLRRATITEATPRCDALTSLELGLNQPDTPYESGPGALPDFQR